MILPPISRFFGFGVLTLIVGAKDRWRGIS